MKKAVIALVVLFGSLAQAGMDPAPVEVEIFDLSPGAGLVRIDVAGLAPRIALRVRVDRIFGVPTLAPDARVVASYGDFECQVRSIELEQSGLHHGFMMEDLYLVKVEWTPGADLSGCSLSITEPFSNRLYPVELYMSF